MKTNTTETTTHATQATAGTVKSSEIVNNPKWISTHIDQNHSIEIENDISVDNLRKTIKECDNRTSLSELEEKEREEAEEKKFIEELNIIKSMPPVTAFVLGMMKAGESESDLAGIIADRLTNNISSLELVARASIMCYANEHEDEVLEGLIETLQKIIDLGVTDAKITGILELLEVVWHNS